MAPVVWLSTYARCPSERAETQMGVGTAIAGLKLRSTGLTGTTELAFELATYSFSASGVSAMDNVVPTVPGSDLMSSTALLVPLTNASDGALPAPATKTADVSVVVTNEGPNPVGNTTSTTLVIPPNVDAGAITLTVSFRKFAERTRAPLAVNEACTGAIPSGITPIFVSPDTLTCIPVPLFAEPLLLITNRLWAALGSGVGGGFGITTGR